MEENPCSLTQGRRYVRFASGSLARLFTSFSQSLSHLCKLFGCTRSVWSGSAASPATARSCQWNWTACTSYRSWYPAASPIASHTVACATFSDRQQPLGICGGLAGGPRDSPRLHAKGQVPDLLEHPRPLLWQEALRKCLPYAVAEKILSLV
jgi:hypothetical protein